MALSLFKEGFTKTYEAYGFYTYQDFHQFGQQVGIKESRVKRIIQEFTTPQEIIQTLIDKSFLKEDMKQAYTSFYEDKVKRLKMQPV